MTTPNDPHAVFDQMMTCVDCGAKFRVVRRSKPKKGETIRYCSSCRSKHSGFFKTNTSFLKKKNAKPD